MHIKLISVSLLLAASSLSWSLPAPEYLSVPHWKRCVHHQTKDKAKFVCLPAKKPVLCPKASWKKISQNQLPACN